MSRGGDDSAPGSEQESAVNTTPIHPKPTTRAYRPAIRHDGPCGERRQCWRPACRAAFPGLRTIELQPDKALAFCHHAIVPTDFARLTVAA